METMDLLGRIRKRTWRYIFEFHARKWRNTFLLTWYNNWKIHAENNEKGFCTEIQHNKISPYFVSHIILFFLTYTYFQLTAVLRKKGNINTYLKTKTKNRNRLATNMTSKYDNMYTTQRFSCTVKTGPKHAVQQALTSQNKLCFLNQSGLK